MKTLHWSMRNHVIRRIPLNMSAVSIHRDLHESASKIATSVFMDCINVGMPMQDALLAVYLTGLENGLAAEAA